MHPLISAVIPVRNESKTIAEVIRNVQALSTDIQVIVVDNGSTDGTADIARRMHAEVYKFEEPLGYDVGRLFGAKQAKGSVILFLDGDFVIPTDELTPFITAVLEDGVDLALNRQPRWIRNDSFGTIVFKYMLNLLLRRKDLLASSMVAVPHALSRRALDTLTHDELAIPPLAQAKLLESNLKVKRVSYVPVSGMNRKRSKENKQFVTELILGDHLEAMSHLLKTMGERGGFTDLGRRRMLLETNPSPQAAIRNVAKQTVTAIIPAMNEQHHIAGVIQAALQAGVTRTLVVVNGSNDATESIARSLGADVLHFTEPLGHDIGRAVGAASSPSDVYVFLDGDIDFTPEEIRPFISAIQEQGVDIALNDLNPLLKANKYVHRVTYAARLLNIALRRSDLGANSMVAVPHALSRKALEVIGHTVLGVPPLAMVKAIQSGELNIRAVHEVNVITKNSRDSATDQVADLIVGDTFEALHTLLQTTGSPRGSFTCDESRIPSSRDPG